MAKANINSKQGFTIIEVVLVLAIAGLIFLMVFVALPALQRSQRDTARRNDMSRVDTSLVQYQTNHSNQAVNLPSEGSWASFDDGSFGDGCTSNSACAFIRDYMNTGSSENDGKPNNFEDPDGTAYSLVITKNWADGVDAASGPNMRDTNQSHSKLGKNADENYTIVDDGGSSYDDHVIYIIPGGRCVGDAATPSTKRHFAILYRLEGAGTYCIDDQ
ncbi:type II secretion system protein [Candidatus Saccharibacteria bacterium]|nr:type II secretion system protein [Candidatus Saccharibacteria bacterium]